MTVSRPYFLALDPDAAFASAVRDRKLQVRQLVGDQLYLGDPPHVTLYLGLFPSEPELRTAVTHAAGRIAPVTADAAGWHVFSADPLTGNHSLVCDITPEGRRRLVEMQREVVAAMAPLRDPDACCRRYAATWSNLSVIEKQNVIDLGFPFVGEIWHPHITIASVKPADWDPVWAALADSPPSGGVRFDSLTLYALETSQPVRLVEIDLEDRQ
jgi:2'-5' RNA ligase